MRKIRVPGDKSVTQRALILASLASGESRLQGLLTGEDPQATAAALRTRRACVLTYPRRNWLTRALVTTINAAQALRKKRFRVYIHKPQEIAALMASNGLARVLHDYSGTFREWEVAVYRREAESSATD